MLKKFFFSLLSFFIFYSTGSSSMETALKAEKLIGFINGLYSKEDLQGEILNCPTIADRHYILKIKFFKSSLDEELYFVKLENRSANNIFLEAYDGYNISDYDNLITFDKIKNEWQGPTWWRDSFGPEPVLPATYDLTSIKIEPAESHDGRSYHAELKTEIISGDYLHRPYEAGEPIYSKSGCIPLDGCYYLGGSIVRNTGGIPLNGALITHSHYY